MQDELQRMQVSMELKGFAQSTQKTYLGHVRRFSTFCNKPLTETNFDDGGDDHTSGFQKIRHYGLLSNRNRNTKLALCKRLTGFPDIREKIKLNARDLIFKLKGIDILRCRSCGGNIKRIASLFTSSD